MSRTRMAKEDLDDFHASLTRCTANSGFLERFYRSFLKTSPLAKEKFKGTNWLRQYRMMVASFHLMSLAAEYDDDGDTHLHRIARTHGSAGHAIPPELFDDWLNSLLEAVEQADPEFDDRVAALWKDVMGRGIDFMRRHAES